MKPSIRLSVLILVFAAGCSDRGSAPAAGGSGAGGTSSDPVPCFPDEGPVVMKIDGVPVPKGALTRYLAMVKARTPAYSDRSAGLVVSENILIPMACLYAQYKDRIPDLSSRAWTAWKRLESGEDFATVVNSTAAHHGAKEKGGIVGTLGRQQQDGGGGMNPAMEDAVFSTPVGSHSRPFFSVLGIQIVKVTKEIAGTSARLDQREVAQIVFHLDPEVERTSLAVRKADQASEEAASKALGEYQQAFVKAKEKAKVEVLDTAYLDWVYPYRRG